MSDICLIAHNLRSTHNVGSLLRTAEGLGISKVYLTGYTPYPLAANDSRLPHLAKKINKAIQKTALGAELSMNWEHTSSVENVIAQLKSNDFTVAAVEQAPNATKLPGYYPPQKIALLVGREVEGVEPAVLALCDLALEIPMFGSKESFNVVQAAAMAMYHCRFADSFLAMRDAS
jgi:tRNA G18 (ribose-2'-O)-methylase SpoU